MDKKFQKFIALLFVFICYCHIGASAQNLKIQGKVVEGKSRESIPFAVVKLTLGDINIKPQVITTDLYGAFTFLLSDSLAIKYNQGTITVITIGVQPVVKTIDLLNDFSKNPLEIEMPIATPLGNETVGIEKEDALSMAYFSWPPPDFSSRIVIAKDKLGNPKNLKTLNEVLTKSLDKRGYYDKGYYLLPSGFAVVTRMEQTDDTGESLKTAERWNQQLYRRSLTWKSYLSQLLLPAKGYFRTIVFVITDAQVTPNSSTISSDIPIKWVHDGLAALPANVGKTKFTKAHNCYMLVYEFESSESSKTKLLTTSRFTNIDLLRKLRIFE